MTGNGLWFDDPIFSYVYTITSFFMMDSIENNYAAYRLAEGIVYIRYHIGINIDLDAAEKIVSDRLKLQAGIAYPALCDIRGVREVNKPARNYLALEGSNLLKAVGFIVEHPLSVALSGFFLRSTKPPISVQFFEDDKEAKFFLAAFK